MLFLFVYLVYLAFMCSLAYVAYFKDKMKARKGLPRISERVLLSVGFFGGAIGALIAMKKHRHKTRHFYFYIINIIGIIMHIGVGALIVIFA